ncbi:23S rRNA (guanine(745)-N(1))-methyltransferase [Photobacterium jeanii]|uniref:23S rRNA (Guanine(745)-N(1))-methyltransferase n=1 Tax=Photobacterium jeanii TaxID=858640 RepID=A0A178KPH9_9GAMM|nr:23S rRNA (guanine(745)-N(1))-methyltransferase [Photobacterium jeanii]OAN18664.1 23S rRNA (guanine(745)-N(1))-methyltransferase [Photobacterium jeanii]PST91656.1 23S rRNA (guanine(745)-N(1))-methyltransferase [Photobacterium jeanii]
MPYQCPLCHQSLNTTTHSWHCENNHQFDLAKEGYVNLMPAHHKSSKNPGDNKEMMQARRFFLNSDHYETLRQNVVSALREHMVSSATDLLDIGCGEGYYTSAFTELNDQHPEFQVHGLDISKVAVRYAAKRAKDCQFSVASSHRLPFAEQSLDAIVRIYAPCKPNELQRVIKENGILVTVTPAARHLYQLRELIYDEVRLHDIAPEHIEGFELVKDQHLLYSMKLNGEEATALMQMTPFAWRTSEAVWQQLAQANDFECEADFAIRVYRKTK